MKNAAFLLTLTATFVIVTAFGFLNRNHPTNPANSPYCDSQFSMTAAMDPWGVIDFENQEHKEPLFFHIMGQYGRAITKLQLMKATSLGDLIEHYPSKWISAYEDVTITAFIDGREIKEYSTDEVLTTAQKMLLASADFGAGVQVKVDYTSESTGSDEPEQNQMVVSMTVIPEREASFPGGLEEMSDYLRTNGNRTTIPTSNDDLDEASILFTITTSGAVENIVLHQSSGDAELDAIAMDLIKNMPSWEPATNYKGEQVNQEFKLVFGKPGC